MIRNSFLITAFLSFIILWFQTNFFNSEIFISGIRNVENKKLKIYDKDSALSNYKNYCASCHGEKMEAFVDRKWKHGNSKDSLFESIKIGNADDGMPGFDTTFTDNEINDLVTYIVNGIGNVKKYDFKEVTVKSNLFTSKLQDIRLDTVVTGLKVPWGMAFLPGDEMLITERSGKLYRLTKKRELQDIEGVPEVLAEGQGGLMDIALHPGYTKNHIIYISYSLPKKTDSITLATTAVMRAKLDGNKLTEQKNIFVALPYSRTKHHYGSRLQFGEDGMLYISVGERGNEKENPQTLRNSLGKIHRVKDDGSIPPDNPFVDSSGAVASIYSYGHRNPQGLAFNPTTGELWSNEHGPRGGDEINIVRKGKNYGWPVITYGINYNGIPMSNITEKEGMERPEWYWIPSIGPSGMAFVTGDRYKGWKGNILSGSLRFKYLNRSKVVNNKITEEEILLKNMGRLRDVRMGPYGYIYVAVEAPAAGIFRLIPVKRK